MSLLAGCSFGTESLEDGSSLIDGLDPASVEVLRARVDTASYGQAYTEYELALGDLLDVCMAEAGFEAPPRPALTFGSPRVEDTIEARQTYGFGSMTQLLYPEHFERERPEGSIDPRAGMADNELSEYRVEYAQCFETSSDLTSDLLPQNRTLSDEVEREFHEALERAEASQLLADSRAAYSECMTGMGYSQLTPESVTSDGLPPDFYDKLNDYKIRFDAATRAADSDGEQSVKLLDVFDQQEVDEIYRLAKLETDVAVANLRCSEGLFLSAESIVASELLVDR